MDKQRILDLDQYRIPCSEGLKVPDSLFYIPDFITAEEEAELIPPDRLVAQMAGFVWSSSPELGRIS